MTPLDSVRYRCFVVLLVGNAHDVFSWQSIVKLSLGDLEQVLSEA